MRNKILSQQKKNFLSTQIKIDARMTYEKGVAMIDGMAVKISKEMSGHEG